MTNQADFPDLAELTRLSEALIELNKTSQWDWAATVEDARIGKTHTEFALAASPAAILALIAESKRLAAQWGDRPAYRTPEYESKRDSMWRRAHMVATAKGYDHINMAIAAAPKACADCMGCGGEWQGEEVPNSVCETCKGSLGKALAAEVDQLKTENESLRKAVTGAIKYVAFAFDQGIEGAEAAGIALEKAAARAARL